MVGDAQTEAVQTVFVFSANTCLAEAGENEQPFGFTPWDFRGGPLCPPRLFSMGERRDPDYQIKRRQLGSGAKAPAEGSPGRSPGISDNQE